MHGAAERRRICQPAELTRSNSFPRSANQLHVGAYRPCSFEDSKGLIMVKTVVRSSIPRSGVGTSVPPESSLRGLATFNAEGSDEPGRYFSRKIHWPGHASGVTIGRGYDLGKRSALEIISDLTKAGVPREDVAIMARAAGLTGVAARNFVEHYKDQIPEISPTAEHRLFFDIAFPRYEADTKRIFESASVQSAYGIRKWRSLPRPVQELLVDLRYRGDYTPATRPYIQRLAAGADVPGLIRVMENRNLWDAFGVSRERQRVRIGILEADGS